MLVRRTAVAMVSVLGALACADGNEQPWGSEAVEFFDARATAVCEHDVYRLASFYDVDAVADYRAIMLGDFVGERRVGRPSILSFLDVCLLSPRREILVEVEEVFLHPDGAVTVERWTDDGEPPIRVATLVVVGRDGIEFIRYFPALEQATDRLLHDRGADGTSGALDEQSVVDAVERLVRDALPRGDTEIYPLLDTQGNLVEVIVVREEDDGACAIRTALWGSVGEADIDEQQRYVATGPGARCGGDLPDGWWTGRAIPAPLDQQRTGRLAVEGQLIDTYNGDDSRLALVEWVVDRFSVLDRPLPAIERVVFEPSARCGDEWGLAEIRPEGSSVYMCVDEVDCASPSCDGFSNQAKLSILHELGHVWLSEAATTEVQAHFLETVGAETWNDQSDEWIERGVEWAAEILAWGLLDRDLELLRLGFPSCETRREGFVVLAGLAPSSPCGER